MMELVKEYIPPLLPSEWCQVTFALAAAGVLTVTVLPSSLGGLLLSYGPRSSGSDGETVPSASRASWLEDTVATLTAWSQVPHWWFATFYATSTTLSAFWAYQYVVDGSIIRLIASGQCLGPTGSRSMAQTGGQTAQDVFVAWALITLQGIRRLYEQLFVAARSSSTMWVVHWLLGMAFYVSMSVAVWIEGSASILDRQPGSSLAQALSVKTGLGAAIFVAASVAQFRCHKHLASLKKYSLPTEGLFRYLVCPHYTCECLLYLSLAVVAAPEGKFLNQTVMSALLFVVLNLGATAHGTRRWYVGKFGATSVASRWTMIPVLY